MKPTIFTHWLSVAWIFMFFFAVPHSLAIEASMEDAVLKGNWEEVYNSLDTDTVKANDPVARLLMGHVCLATNRNNESMLLFLSVKEENDLKLWSEWIDSLLSKYSRNPIALYLSADAKARAGKFEEAQEGFTQALQRKEDFALALNARGVIRTLTNDWDNAQVDFYLATKLDPSFADAYANLGILGILRETSLDLDTGTLDAFNQALNINPEFALAYNGRGCIYFGSGRFEESAKDFEMAFQLSPILVMAEINQGFASAYASKLVTLASVERKPGTTFENLNQRYPDVLREQKQNLLNLLPPQNDQQFWTKIDALPRLSNDQFQTAIREHGLQKVQMSTSLKMLELQDQIPKNYQVNPPFIEKIDFSNWISSLAYSDLTKGMQRDWHSLLSQSTNRVDVGKIVSGFASTETSPPRFLIDIPGVGWTGGARENDWGSMLSSNKTTIYIRHQGPGRDKWDQPKELNAIVVTLPHQWDVKSAKELLLPHLNSEFSQGNDVHLIIDENITFVRHITLPKPEEDRWAANVTDYISTYRPSNYSGILAEHSRGTVTNQYIEDFTPFERIIVSSPRGDDALSWIHKTPNLPPIDIITGLSDAPNWRWTERYGALLKENPNVRVIQLQDMANPATTHSRLQNLGTGGTWKIITGIGSHDFTGQLGDIYMPMYFNKFLPYNEISSTALLGARYKVYENTFDRLNQTYTSAPKIQSSSLIPSYLTSVDRPVTELSSLASMVDKGIKPIGDLPRSALIVSQDPFRTNLLQSELSKHGFQTKVISPGTDPQITAKQWGADVILGIRANPEMKMPEIKSISAGIKTPQVTLPPIKQNWDWGKLYIPNYPKGGPGGISTEELAKSFVDKGNWPVLTCFGLFYEAGPSMMGAIQEGGK